MPGSAGALQGQLATGTSSSTAARPAQHLSPPRPTGQAHTRGAIPTQAPAIDGRTIDGRFGSATAEEEAQPRGEEEDAASGGDAGSDAAGAPLLPVNGPTIVTADGRFTAWRVPGALSSHLATCDPKVAVNNFWRHEVNCGCNLQMLWLSHGAYLLRSDTTSLLVSSSHLGISSWSILGGYPALKGLSSVLLSSMDMF